MHQTPCATLRAAYSIFELCPSQQLHSFAQLFFSFEGAISLYYFYLQPLSVGSFSAITGTSIVLGANLRLDLVQKKNPALMTLIHGEGRQRSKANYEPTYHVLYYHNKTPTSLAATWQSTRAFPLAVVSLKIILYATVLVVNVSSDHYCNH